MFFLFVFFCLTRSDLRSKGQFRLNDLICLVQDERRASPPVLPAVLDDPLALRAGLLVTGSAQLVALKLQRQAQSQRGHLDHKDQLRCVEIQVIQRPRA